MADNQIKDDANASRSQAVIAGGVAGLAARFCIAPLDVVKIHVQLQTHRLQGIARNDRGITHQCKTIYQQFGITGFWRGNVPAEWLYLTYNGAQFLAYRSMNQLLESSKMPNKAKSFVAGATAGAFGTVATYPFDLLRTRFAAQGQTKMYTSLLDGFRKVVKTEGFPGLYKGLSPAIGQIVPAMGLFFLGYESLRPFFKKLELPLGSEDAIAGAMASITSKTVVFPLDLVRKRLQVQGPVRSSMAGGLVPEYGPGLLIAGRSIIRQEGWRGLYKGLSIGLIKATPTAALSIWFYERALHALMAYEILA